MRQRHGRLRRTGRLLPDMAVFSFASTQTQPEARGCVGVDFEECRRRILLTLLLRQELVGGSRLHFVCCYCACMRYAVRVGRRVGLRP